MMLLLHIWLTDDQRPDLRYALLGNEERRIERGFGFVKRPRQKNLSYLQYGPAAGSVRAQPEVPAMGFVAPPTVVFALRGVLP